MVVLIIGYGSIAKKHSQTLFNIDPSCEIYALRSSKNAEKIDGINNIYSYNEVSFQPDFIIISSPTFNHYKDIINCLRFKSPLFIEKPVIGSLENVDSLTKEIERANVLSYVACVLRFHPCLRYIKENLLPFNRINEVNIYCGSYLPNWRPEKNFRTSYSAQSSLGGGVHLDLIHELDYPYWLFGKPEYWHSYSTSKSSLEIDAYDSASYLLSYKYFNINIILNYFRRSPKRTIELVCENDTFEVDLIKNTIIKENGDEIFSAKNTNILDLYKTQLEYFIDCIKSGTRCENDFKTAVDVLKICLLNNYAKG